MSRTIRIPGKVMLSGEYAVLYGGTAAMATVPRFLEVDLGDHESATVTPVAKAALAEVIPELVEHEKSFGQPLPRFNPAEFFEEAQSGSTAKLGIGLSSAEAVGTIALRYAAAGLDWRERLDDVFHHAFVAHTNAQQGIGSGADVAACTYQVPLWYGLPEGRPQVRPVPHIPRQCVPVVLAWTGESADTRLLVQRFSAWVENGGRRAKELLDQLVTASEELAPCWFMAASDKLFAALGEYQAVLNLCATAANIPYRLPVHQQLTSWAVNRGGKAKPAGAGGGDMLLLVGHLPYEELDMPLIRLDY